MTGRSGRERLCLAAIAWGGHKECVRLLLLPVSNATAEDCCALRIAAENGHVECLWLRLPVSDPMAADSYALRWAVRCGHAECVKLLLPVSDAKAEKSWALRFAAERGMSSASDCCWQRRVRFVKSVDCSNRYLSVGKPRWLRC